MSRPSSSQSDLRIRSELRWLAHGSPARGSGVRGLLEDPAAAERRCGGAGSESRPSSIGFFCVDLLAWEVAMLPELVLNNTETELCLNSS